MNPRIDKAIPAVSTLGLGVNSPLRPFLAFLRQRMSLLLVWPAIALVVIAILWSHVLRGLGHEERERGAELEQQAGAYAWKQGSFLNSIFLR
jgi:hypothetical protein